MISLRELFETEGKILAKRRKILNKELEKEGLYFGQPKILKTIENNVECDQNTLAKELNCSKASITCSIKRLEKAGLIKKEISKKDMRYNVIRLTETGIEKSKKADEILLKTVENQFKDFSLEEMETIHRLYNKIINNLENEEGKEI